MYCVHVRESRSMHAAANLRARYGVSARCVHIGSQETSKEPPDLYRQRAHLEAVRMAVSEGVSKAVFVENGACLTDNPMTSPEPLGSWEMLCLSGSASLIRMFHSPFVGASQATVEPRDAEEAFQKHEIVTIGEQDPSEARGPRARLPKSVTLNRALYSELKKRGRMCDTVEGISDALAEMTRVHGYDGRGKEVVFVLGIPTTLTCYVLRGDGLSKTTKLLEFTTTTSPLPDVLSFEKHIKNRVECVLTLRPLCEAKFVLVRDYVHMLSKIPRSLPLSRERLTVRTARMSEDGTAVYVGERPDNSLPKVSIITITRNRRRIFSIATYMVLKTVYPRDRLEWVIVDDSDDGKDAYPSLGQLRGDPMVRYRRLETDNGKPFRIGHKRELACQMATGDVFVHLDDDDFLPPLGVMIRVKALLEYNASCMGATRMLCHVYKTGRTFFSTVEDGYGDHVAFGEPSMAYTREFWKSRHWNTGVHMDEGRYFLLGRDYSTFINVPSQFHCVAITHGKNITGNLRDGLSVGWAKEFDKKEIFGPELIRLLDSAFR